MCAVYLPVYKTVIKQGKGNVTLDAANQLYVADAFHLFDSFQSAMMEYFGAQTKIVDFGLDQTRIDINNWVSTVTHQMIKDLLPSGRSLLLFQ